MVKCLIALFVIGIISDCSRPVDSFDQKILDELRTCNYSLSVISDSAFQVLKETIKKNWVLSETTTNALDAYSLVGFINKIHPDFNTFLNKYNEMKPLWRISFFEVLVSSRNTFYSENRVALQKLLAEVDPGKYYTINKKILMLYMALPHPDIAAFKSLLATESITGREHMLLANLMLAERENVFGYHLLIYLHERKDWPELDNYIRYWDLYETKNPELNQKYKSFFRHELLNKGYDDTPWNGYASFLPNWFSKAEIIEICTKKQQETEVYPRYFDNAMRDMPSSDFYISKAGYYQAVYFPIEQTIKLIEQTRLPYLKLKLIYTLVNNRFDINKSDREKLMNILLSFADKIHESSGSELAVLAVKSLKPDAQYDFVQSKFPNLAKGWNPPNYLEIKFNTARYSWKDFIDISNSLNTFGKPLTEPGEYEKCEYMNANYAYRLDNVDVINTILKANKKCISLDEEAGSWPVDYQFILSNAFENFSFDSGNVPEFLYTFEYGKDTAVAYTLYLKMKDKLHTVKFTSANGLPNNKVIWLLLNKMLIDSGVKERLLKFNTESYDLAYVQPGKYEQLMEKLNIR